MNLQNQPSKRLKTLLKAVCIAKHYADVLDQDNALQDLQQWQDDIEMALKFAKDAEKELPFPHKPSEN